MISKFINENLYCPPIKPDSWMFKGISKFNSKFNIPYTEWESDIEDEDCDLYVKILFSHGNGDDLYTLRRIMKDLITIHLKNLVCGKRVKYHIRAWDYPFYGESAKPRSELNEKQIYEDHKLITDDFFNLKIDGEAEQLNVLMGFSLGCGPCTNYAVDYADSFEGLIFLIAPFKSVLTVGGWSGFFAKTFVKDQFPNFSNLFYIKDNDKINVTIIQSRDDEVIDFKTNDFTKIRPDALRVLKGFKHNDFLGKEGSSIIASVLKDQIENFFYDKKNKIKFKEDERVY